MSKRDEILTDRDFWLQLEFTASGWFRTCDDHKRRGYWIDGFLPRVARNTKLGIEVEGTAWVVDGTGHQTEYEFVADLPQKLLHRPTPAFVIEALSLDEAHRTLRIELARPKAIAEPSASPNGGPAERLANSGVGGGPPSVS
jgi:hypothetical protein